MGTAMNSSDQTAQPLQPYNFELLQGLHDIRPFMKEYWTTSFHIALIYLLLIFVGHNYMKARKGFNLKGPLILWSFCLAIFSLFLLSKIIELGDTAFIVLRKRPLIFVHWYHHSTVLVFTSFAYKNKVAAGGWFMTMNFGVHAVMYTYYTLKAARVEPPRWFPRLITTLQILQMFMGAIVVILTYVWRQEQGCHTTAEHFFWSFILYLTYFILFAHFFHKTYIMPKVKANTKRE
ncbi:very long chain fatty acid elongase 3 isoform 2-T2 [Hipposideros larvatus]